jgi:hypothetical protein
MTLNGIKRTHAQRFEHAAFSADSAQILAADLSLVTVFPLGS